MPLLEEKALQVQNDYKANRPPSESYSDAQCFYYKHLNHEDFLGDHYKIAFDIFEDNFKKELFEGLLLGEAAQDDVEQVFGIPDQSRKVYEELFFNQKSAFRTKLDKISYIENYPDKFGKEIKLRAYSLGPDFLYYTYAQIIPKNKSQHNLVKRIFLTSAYKAMAMNFTGPNAKLNKEGMEFAKIMLKAYDALSKWSEEDGSEDMDIVKVLVKKTSAVESFTPEEEIV